MKNWICYLAASTMIFGGLLLSGDAAQKPGYLPRKYEYLLGKIPGLSDDLLKMHFTLYNGYVTNTNILLDKLNELVQQKKNEHS
jgi:Fe-Mn family superoxide dismutase